MLLTLYYLAATWLQSWRLNGIRSKISQVRKQHGTLLLYKDVDRSVQGEANVQLSESAAYLGLHSGANSCINRKDAKVADLLWYNTNKVGLSLFPEQILDISEWIGVPGKKTLLPVELSGSRTSLLSETNVLYFVIEADFNILFTPTHTHHCQVEDFGVACAWKAGNVLSLLIESDEENLAKLTASFMSNSLSTGPGLEMIRVQSVDIKGRPCFLLNADSIPTLHASNLGHSNLVTARNQWQNHIGLLRSFSKAASQAVRKSEPTPVNDHWSAVLMPGGEGNYNTNMETEIETSTYTKTLEIENTMEISSPVTEEPPTKGKFKSLKEMTLSSPMTEEAPVVKNIKDMREMTLSSPMTEDPPGLRRKEMNSPTAHKVKELTLSSPMTEESDIVSDNQSHVKSKKTESGVVVNLNDKSEVEVSERSVSMTSLSAQPGSGEDGSTMSSFGSLSRMSTDTLLATSPQSRTARMNGSSTCSLGSLRSISTTHTKSDSAETGKAPNIVIYSESSVSVESVKAALSNTLHTDRYTIYSLSLSDMLSSPWLSQASLVVVCGSVPTSLVPLLMQYILNKGGAVLCLCSDLLGVLLPMFHTAEVRPDQLVTFSYSNWKNVRMMHHIFCYQASPKTAKFSLSDEQNSYPASAVPESIEVKDKDNKPHKLSVKVLGVEETWQTPSLIIAQSTASGGKVVFSQVHLETDPRQYESDEDKMQALQKSNQVRLEILTDILSSQLGLHCSPQRPDIKYTTAYFLGDHELKQALMDQLKPRLEGDLLKLQKLSLKFCGKGVEPSEATPAVLPILMYTCPQSFSPVTYFDNLTTKQIGRLVIYTEVLTTSMYLIEGPPLAHGLAVIPCRQTTGVGRGGNTWLSPDGCAMFSMQLHIPLKSEMGHYLSFLQHLVALAVVHSISKQPGLQDLELRLKWPNDMYSRKMKLGGVIVNSIVEDKIAVANVGCGFNLNNQYPTTCVNNMIEELNGQNGGKIPKLSREKYFAIVFSELESLIYQVNAGLLEDVTELYYKYWLHDMAKVDVKDPDGSIQHVTIIGINEYGFLKVRNEDGNMFTVQPDGNSFDMMAGLIAPKIKT